MYCKSSQYDYCRFILVSGQFIYNTLTVIQSLLKLFCVQFTYCIRLYDPADQYAVIAYY